MPDWFKESNYGMDLADDNVLMKLYEDVESQMKAHRETQAAGIKAAKDAVKAAVSEDKQQ